MSDGTVQSKVALVAPATGFVAHVRSASDIVPSLLKSIQPHKRAVLSTPDKATVKLYGWPASVTLSAPNDEIPSSLAGIVEPKETASAFVVPYSTLRLSAVTTEPSFKCPTT